MDIFAIGRELCEPFATLVKVLLLLSFVLPMRLLSAVLVIKRLTSKTKPFGFNCCWIWQVHMCNKLASRHVRVGLANPSAVPRCDICENTPAFFYCEIDGTSLCLQCDMIVHVGGKRTHGRYLLLRQRVEFPGDKPGNIGNPTSQPLDPSETRRGQNQAAKLTLGENQQNDKASLVQGIDAGSDGHLEMDTRMIDLNMKPHRIHGQASNNQEQ
ncbi:hypothetical protein V6N13_086118 [Hibiscus sabdariffa]|uniref:B box-type domain-containing protein n=1 Tax=Hibiscus sabdariffa TaxID=183260 RepID=A0ABR2FSZ6_9ROSI